MSKKHVEVVFGPEWVQRARADSEARLRGAERAVLCLRHALRCEDGSLPNVYDGNAWMEIEAEWLRDMEESSYYLPPSR